MKVLLIANFFPPTHTAGTEQRTFGYALQLRARGVNVQVLCAGDWQQGAYYWNGYTDEQVQGVPVRRLHLNWALAPDPNRALYRNPLVAEHLDRWLAEWQPDLVHVTSCYTLSASVIEVAKTHKLPVVLTLTDYWFLCPRLSLLRSDGALCTGKTTGAECLHCLLGDSKLYQRLNPLLPRRVSQSLVKWASSKPRINRLRGLRGLALNMDERKAYLTQMLALADRVTAPSHHLAATFAAAGVVTPIQVIHSGHDLHWLATMPAKRRTQRIRFGYIGQISPLKGVHTLVAAFGALAPAAEAQLQLYGDAQKLPHYYQELKAIIEAHQSPVEFCGPFAHERLGEILAEIDVLIAPSEWHENNPRAIQEAFASKTPVIASDVGGIAEFVQHGVNGLLFARGDVTGLAHQMQRFLQEPGLLAHLTTGIPVVKSMAAEVDEIGALYQELLKRPLPMAESAVLASAW